MFCIFLCVWVLVTQSCLTLCDTMDCSSPGSSVHGIIQTGILEWVAISFSRDLPNPGLLHCRQIFYCLSHQGSPLILEWVRYPSPGDLPDPGIEPGSPALQVNSLPDDLPGKSIKLATFLQ